MTAVFKSLKLQLCSRQEAVRKLPGCHHLPDHQIREDYAAGKDDSECRRCTDECLARVRIQYNLTGTLSNEFQLNQKMKDDFGPISVHCEYVHLDVTDKVSFLLKYSFLSYYHFKAFLPEKTVSVLNFFHIVAGQRGRNQGS